MNPPPTTATTGNENANIGQNANETGVRSNRRRGNLRNGTVVSSNPRGWDGDTPEIGGVIGLQSEQLDKKCSFNIYKEKVAFHIQRTYKDTGQYLICAINDYLDPVMESNSNHSPAALTAIEKR